MIIFIVRQLFREGRLIRERLTDYVRVGWLPSGDPAAFSRLRTRSRALWHAIFLGPDAFLATIRMQRAATELAYLRDAMTRGLVNDAGLLREKALLARLREQRASAIVQPDGRAAYPSFRRTQGSRTRVRATELSRTGRHRRQLPGPGGGCGAVGADCYPIFGGRSQLEASRRVGGGQMASPGAR